jgi:tetratricopeptide (TPR) repeat protein
LHAIFSQWASGLTDVEWADLFGSRDREAGLRRTREAINQFIGEMGESHLAVQFCLVEQARYFEMKGDQRHDPWYYERAEEVYREGLECLRKGCGRQPRLAMCMERLAGLLEKRGEEHEAAALLHNALDIRTPILGAEHRDTIRTRQALERLGRVEQAQDSNAAACGQCGRTD